MTFLLREIDRATLGSDRRVTLDAETVSAVAGILSEIRSDPQRVLAYAELFDGRKSGAPLSLSRNSLKVAYDGLDDATRGVIDRCYARIHAFACAQRDSLADLDLKIEGGRAGHRFVPHRVAGCYAPGGRFALPSSVLMTVVPARVAGVQEIWVASPRPTPVVQAAAYRAGADALLVLGGAQAIGSMAYGLAPAPQCDVIVGPGNRYVTAAKHLVRDQVAIDMLAGPSELLILADESATPELVAWDLLAQAEHDVDAWPVLVSTDRGLIERVQRCLESQLRDLDTRTVAEQALARGGYILAESRDDMAALSEQIAAEHLQVMTREPEVLAARLSRFGSLFIGEASAEVMADYGAGPNHVLPTGKSARVRGGLSILDFMSLRTWMKLDKADPGYLRVARDSERLAQLEGLCAHARSAKAREQQVS